MQNYPQNFSSFEPKTLDLGRKFSKKSKRIKKNGQNPKFYVSKGHNFLYNKIRA